MKPAEDAKGKETRGSVFVVFAKCLCVLCVRINVKSALRNSVDSIRRKTQRSRSEGREAKPAEDAKGKESRGSVFETFANVFASFAFEST
ncbi:MAG: hypothetical protein DCC44_05540 [Acidobacteria bacterium]|nr:MAG: hypothetical protein DCC44_05540 [Acidobacteriota bacterium]